MAKTYELVILAPARSELHEIARLHMVLVGPVSARNIVDGRTNYKQVLSDMPDV